MHVWLALALVLAPAPMPEPVAPAVEAPAEPERDPAERAAELFGAGEFLEAAAAFEEAFAKTGDPAFVFGRAQALRRAGNCAAAIDELERFIDLAPPQNDIDEAKTVIASCRRVLGIEAKSDAPEAVARPEPTPPPAPRPRPWHRDPAGAALLGSGLVLSAIGGGLLGGSFARARDRDETESAWESRGRSVRVLSTAGIVMLGVGGALVIAGVIRWAVVARRNRTSGPAPVARH
jgi:tetratricopeptide (TPR) repeat protein